MMKRKFVFPAIIERDKISGNYTVVFPDLPGCAFEGEDFIQAYYWAGPRLGFHLYMMDREHEHIPEASETSGWEIAADAVVVRIEAGLQEWCLVPEKPPKKYHLLEISLVIMRVWRHKN
ncbi:MAG TPA: hypothetical protein DEF89_13525 [Desulfosporosinus sp.]|nr:hypothetical protein [Desulfosporosinus sp.]